MTARRPPDRRTPVSRLDAHLGFWLRYVSNHVSSRFAQAVEQRGVSVSEWVALRTLYDGQAAPAQLIGALGMTKGAVSKIVARLEARGLVVRESAPDDGRAQLLSLSADGRKLVPQLARLADENDQLFFGHMTEQAKARLTNALRELVEVHGLRELPVD